MDVKKFTLLSVFFSTMYFGVDAQKIENVVATAEGSKIIVTYDLLSDDSNQKFDIEVFSSHNDFTTPAQLVKGDVGKDVLPGTGKRVEWNARAELRNFEGEISVELRGEVKKPLFTFISPKENATVRKGKTTSIVWDGGSGSERFKLDLVQNDVVIQSLGSISNTGLHTWTVPKDTPGGKGYQFRITFAEQKILSNSFKIKGKYPVLLLAAPVPVLGIGGYLIYKLITSEKDLPFPPNEPN